MKATDARMLGLMAHLFVGVLAVAIISIVLIGAAAWAEIHALAQHQDPAVWLVLMYVAAFAVIFGWIFTYVKVSMGNLLQEYRQARMKQKLKEEQWANWQPPMARNEDYL